MASQVGAINSVNALISKVFRQPKGELVDRLNHQTTVCILAVSAGLLMSTTIMGDPIICWTPAQFTKQWSDFVNQYCFVHGTYYSSLEEQLPFEDAERKRVPIQYYQWVPYVLALQAFLFYLPRVIWSSLLAYSGYDLTGAIKYVDGFWRSIRDRDDAFKVRIAAFEGRPSVFIWDGLRLARRKQSGKLALFYTWSTVIQAANACLQFYIINILLGSHLYNFWGPQVLVDLLRGRDWQMESVLCVLSLNIYYEKLFIFLWFWLAFVAVASVANSMKWICSLCTSSKANYLISSYLKTSPMKSNVSQDQFLRILGADGLFILEHMALNLGDIPASYLTISMRNICENWLPSDDEDDDEHTPLTVKSIKNM